MHRQSLGSPASKLPAEHSPNRTATSSALSIDQDNDDKSLKTPKPSVKPERFLHVIPLLTLLCFLVLYLSSHHPSQTELAEFSGFNWPMKTQTQENNEIEGLEKYIQVGKGDILGIRSLKNLEEKETSGSKYRLHRKIAKFQ